MMKIVNLGNNMAVAIPFCNLS